jgi:hypothetical protein
VCAAVAASVDDGVDDYFWIDTDGDGGFGIAGYRNAPLGRTVIGGFVDLDVVDAVCCAYLYLLLDVAKVRLGGLVASSK